MFPTKKKKSKYIQKAVPVSTPETQAAWTVTTPYYAASTNSIAFSTFEYAPNRVLSFDLETGATTNSIKNEEANMYSVEKQTRGHLETRANQVFWNKDAQLHKDFHLDTDESPRTAKEFFQRIKDGKYTYPRYWDDGEDGDYGRFCLAEVGYGITWRDPKTPEDRAGYNAAHAKLAKQKTAVNDIIYVDDPKAALKALQDFEAMPSTAFH